MTTNARSGAARQLSLVVALVALAMPALAANHDNWIGTWASSPTSAPAAGRVGDFQLPEPTILKGTVRYRLRIAAGGTQIRLRLSNEYGTRPLVVNAVTVGLAAAGLDAKPGSIAPVLFSQRGAFTLYEGTPVLSDVIAMRVPALADLVVSVAVDALPVNYCPANTPMSEHGVAEGVDRTRDERWADAKCLFRTRPIVTAVDVLAPDAGRVVVALGDSITDGTARTADGDRGWPGVLARRLQGKASVVNAGIAGNRLLQQSAPVFGASVLARLDRDVFAVPGVTHIVMLIGINDMGHTGPGAAFGDTPLVEPKELIAGLLQVIARAHEHGIRIVGATLPPFGGATTYSEAREAVRAAVNEWIRTARAFDGVVDFEAAVRDPADPLKLRADYDSGDHLHPSALGYARMGEVIDTGLFR